MALSPDLVQNILINFEEQLQTALQDAAQKTPSQNAASVMSIVSALYHEFSTDGEDGSLRAAFTPETLARVATSVASRGGLDQIAVQALLQAVVPSIVDTVESAAVSFLDTLDANDDGYITTTEVNLFVEQHTATFLPKAFRTILGTVVFSLSKCSCRRRRKFRFVTGLSAEAESVNSSPTPHAKAQAKSAAKAAPPVTLVPSKAVPPVTTVPSKAASSITAVPSEAVPPVTTAPSKAASAMTVPSKAASSKTAVPSEAVSPVTTVPSKAAPPITTVHPEAASPSAVGPDALAPLAPPDSIAEARQDASHAAPWPDDTLDPRDSPPSPLPLTRQSSNLPEQTIAVAKTKPRGRPKAKANADVVIVSATLEPSPLVEEAAEVPEAAEEAEGAMGDPVEKALGEEATQPAATSQGSKTRKRKADAGARQGTLKGRK